MADRKLKVAIVGLGRMGSIHATNFAYFVPRAEVVAVCDVRDESLQWAKENLPPKVKGYKDVEEMFKTSGAEATLIVTETSRHAPLAELAMSYGLHVLLEKPISVDVETSRRVVETAKRYPNLKTMVAFVRRFDDSNRELKTLIDSGFFVKFSATSGGIFTDVGVHDIDQARWMCGVPNGCPNSKQEVSRVFAIGQAIQHPELAQLGDADNGFGIVEFTNGVNAIMHLGRIARNGHECYLEVYGTESRVNVNNDAQANKLEIRDLHGVRKESHQTHFARFKEAFVKELQDFTACVLDDQPLPVNLQDALEASKIAYALTLSFRKGVPVFFDQQGEIIPPQ
ncbi:myo-inositol 2-dehydrogenase [Cryptococcus deuterogattii MMRL2647]|nr:myo-inositol 2-dehydrogenase [Cryptococcus deuterogattii MMRL2647]